MENFTGDNEDEQREHLSTRKMRVYRIYQTEVFREVIALKTREEAESGSISIQDVRIGELPAILVSGESDEEPVEWASAIKLLTSVSLNFTRKTASAALVFAVDSSVYAVTFGQGWRYIRESIIDRDFGLDVAVRFLDPDEIRKITRWALSAKSQVDQNNVPGGQGIWAFGLREHSEVVRNLTGRVSDPLSISMTHVHRRGKRRDFSLSIECGDGLSIPLGIEADSLIADLRELNRILQVRPPHDRLEPLQWVRRLAQGNDLREVLNEFAAELLANPDPLRGEVGIAYPSKYYDGPDVQHFRGNVGDLVIDTDELNLAHLSAGVRLDSQGDKLRVLNSSSIEGFNESGDSLGGEISALHWMSAEVIDPNSRYILLDGDWYEIGDKYLAHVDRIIGEAFANAPQWTLPPWDAAPKNEKGTVTEKSYNEYVAEKMPGFLCLDRKLIATRVHPRGFEACDLLSPDNYLVHVKKATSETGSSVLSHLFAQGLVSAENLTDTETWKKFTKRVREQDSVRADQLGNRPAGLIYAIHMPDRELSPDSLFTFARSTLVSAAIALTTYGIPLQVAVIP